MQRIVRPKERAEFESCIMRLTMGYQCILLGHWSAEVYLLPTVLGELDAVVWCGLMNVTIF